MRKFSLCNLQRHCGFNPQSPANNAFRVGIAGGLVSEAELQARNNAKRGRLRLRSVFATMCIGLFLLMANFAFGQKNNEPKNWSREDFIKNEINTVSAYSYQFDVNGNITQDSFLIYKEQFDVQENKIIGVHTEKVSFEAYYNVIGQLVKYRTTDEGDSDLSSESEEYEYDSLNREIKITEISVYGVYLKKFFSQSIQTKIYEYVYNSNNKKIECYETGSAQYIQYKKTRQKLKTKSNAFYNDPKRLTKQWKYDSLSNLTELVVGVDSNFFYHKKKYFYDDQNRLIKQIDSCGYLCLDRTLIYEYTDTGKIKTHTYNREEDTIPYTNISYYNNDDEIVKVCSIHGSEYSCTEYFYFYFYENDKLTKKTKKTSYGTIYVTMYSYNEKGLLKEEQTIREDKTIKLIRYYYE